MELLAYISMKIIIDVFAIDVNIHHATMLLHIASSKSCEFLYTYTKLYT